MCILLMRFFTLFNIGFVQSSLSSVDVGWCDQEVFVCITDHDEVICKWVVWEVLSKGELLRHEVILRGYD